jgi:hypothetical protein
VEQTVEVVRDHEGGTRRADGFGPPNVTFIGDVEWTHATSNGGGATDTNSRRGGHPQRGGPHARGPLKADRRPWRPAEDLGPPASERQTSRSGPATVKLVEGAGEANDPQHSEAHDAPTRQGGTGSPVETAASHSHLARARRAGSLEGQVNTTSGDLGDQMTAYMT